MNPAAIQAEYYEKTATIYEEQHVDPDDEHYFALKHIVFYLNWIGAENVLDTGCGTGRSMSFIQHALPGIRVHGNDPSQALLDVAVSANGLPASSLDCVESENLPYPDGAFDAVVETGVLHHVAEPDLVIREMLRVSRKAIFLSDSNIYGQGRALSGIAKFGLSRANLLGTVNRLRRGGKPWYYSEGDGVAYSYSVFDSIRALDSHCAQVIVIPTQPKSATSGAFPLLGSKHCLVCAFKRALPVSPASPRAVDN